MIEPSASDHIEFGNASLENTTVVSSSREETIRMLFLFPSYFIAFFLPGLEHATPWFHEDIFKRMTGSLSQWLTIAIPRAHAKTTLAKLAVVWHFLFSKYSFILYVSNTSRFAQNYCIDIMNFFESDNFISVFGRIKVIKKSETDGLWIFELRTASGKIKRCILRAAGAEQQMRGINIGNLRPELAFVDDLEDLDNTGSELRQAKLDDWVFGTFIKALSRKGSIIWIGNMLSSTSLLARFSRNPIRNPIVFGSLIENEDGSIETLWPDLWPIEELVQDFKDYCDMGKSARWFCEMMNLPGLGQRGFRVEQIKRYDTPEPDSILCSFITIDPAYGKDPAVHDKSAAVCYGIVEGVGTVVLEYVHAQLDEVSLFGEALRMATKWNAWCWGVEGNAQQSAIIKLFEVLKVQKQVSGLQIETLNPANRPKKARISAWVSAMNDGEFYIPLYDMEITNQLLQYDKKLTDQPDDLIDACAYGLDMITLHMETIIQLYDYSKRQKQAAQQIKTSVEVCNV